MADILLGIKIDDTQLKDLMKRVNDLTTNIKNIDAGFKTLSQTIQNVNQNIQQISQALQNASTNSNRTHNTISNITKHIYKWGALISGMVMLLRGGGLFGMRRLADDLVARRKRDLAGGTGGGTYAERMALEMGGQSIFQDTQGVMF